MAEATDTGGSAAQDDAAAVAASVGSEAAADDAASVAAAVGGGETPWSLAEGIAGEGVAPKWFKADKYATVADQAKGYNELASKFGSFTGAPETYEPVALREELVEMGIEIDAESPLMEKAIEFAKGSGMSQEGLNKMVELYAESQVADNMAMEDFKAEELKSLGNNADTRLSNLNLWANANLPEEMVEGFQNLATSADSVKVLERLVAKRGAAPIAANGAAAPGGLTAEDVNKMQFETDEHGNRKLSTNPEFRKKFEAASLQVHGAHENRIMVGG